MRFTLVSLIAGFTLVTVACGDQGLGRVESKIDLVAYTEGQAYAGHDDAADRIDLGQVSVFGTRWAVFRAVNDSGAILRIKGATYTDFTGSIWGQARWVAPADVAFPHLPFNEGGSAFPAEAPARSEILIGIPYSPEIPGSHRGTLQIESDATNVERGIVSGTVTAEAIYTGEADIQIEYGAYVGPDPGPDLTSGDCVDVDGDLVVDGCSIPPGDALRFANVAVGAVGVARLTIRNTGSCTAYAGIDPCSLCSLQIRPDPTRLNIGIGFKSGTNTDGYFRLAQDPPSSINVAQRYVGAECTAEGKLLLLVEVEPPSVGIFRTTLVVESNDADEPLIEIPIEAQATSAPIAIAKFREYDAGNPSANWSDPNDIAPLEVVYLDGRDSYDPADPTNPMAINAYQWQIVSAPEGADASQYDMHGVTSSLFDFWLPIAGTYVAKLTVWNSTGTPSGDTTSAYVEINAKPRDLLHIQLMWDDTNNDQDLHLVFLDQDDRVCNALWDCSYQNCGENSQQAAPVWFASDAAREGANPSLDIDDTNGTGPENINIEAPQPGTYRVFVHYYSYGTPPDVDATRNTVRIYANGVQLGEFRRTLTTEKQIWAVADVVWGASNMATIVPYPADQNGEVGAVAVMDDCATPGWSFPP